MIDNTEIPVGLTEAEIKLVLGAIGESAKVWPRDVNSPFPALRNKLLDALPWRPKVKGLAHFGNARVEVKALFNESAWVIGIDPPFGPPFTVAVTQLTEHTTPVPDFINDPPGSWVSMDTLGGNNACGGMGADK